MTLLGVWTYLRFDKISSMLKEMRHFENFCCKSHTSFKYQKRAETYLVSVKYNEIDIGAQIETQIS